MGLFYVRNNLGQSVPLSALTRVEPRTGPELIMHYNEYPAAQINGSTAPGFSSAQATRALEEVFAQSMPKEMGFDYLGMSFQEQKAAQGISPALIFGLSLVVVFFSSWRRSTRVGRCPSASCSAPRWRSSALFSPWSPAVSRTTSMCRLG